MTHDDLHHDDALSPTPAAATESDPQEVVERGS